MINFPCKISINVPVGGNLLEYVRKSNGQIVRGGSEDIDFSSKGQLPHITLLMGDIESETNCARLLQVIADSSQTHSTFNFNVSLPYAAQPGGRFCFLSILEPNGFIQLKKDLALAVNSIMKFDFHGGPENSPHVTLGYFNSPQVDLRSYQFEIFSNSCKASQIAISFVGNRGTCVENVAAYYLHDE